MNMMKGPARIGFVVALLALLLSPLAFGGHSAIAQGPTQAIYYGGGLEGGSMVAASVDGVVCAESEARADGQWSLEVHEDGCGGGAVDGATVTFQVNGQDAEQTATWAAADAQVIALTIAAPAPVATPEATPAMPEATPEATPAMPEATPEATPAMPEATPEATPAMPEATPEATLPAPPEDVGNAGLAADAGSASMFLVLALGALAVAGVAGARTVTGRID